MQLCAGAAPTVLRGNDLIKPDRKVTQRRTTMSLMFIRVFAGFLAGLAAGILIMRVTYKKAHTIESGDAKTPHVVTTSTRAS
jgi:hypothetical protein